MHVRDTPLPQATTPPQLAPAQASTLDLSETFGANLSAGNSPGSSWTSLRLRRSSQEFLVESSGLNTSEGEVINSMVFYLINLFR